MSFADTANIKVTAGSGGNGAVSFRHEKYISKGGPDGGDGGDGGSIIAQASDNTHGLADYRSKTQYKAKDGQSGQERNKHGKSATDLVLMFPVGTQIYDHDTMLVDLSQVGQRQVIAKGGGGGFGNAHFKSSVRQAPRVAEKGEPGQERDLTLELKLIAEIGLVGFPNAGKSTFLARVTNARPKIADYPFTTLKPNIGVVDIDGYSRLIADIPGLVEGASEGKGLGLDFLRHIDRTSVIFHLIDTYSEDIVGQYQLIRKELASFQQGQLDLKPEIILLTKTEAQDDKILGQQKKQLEKISKSPVFLISSASGSGVKEVLWAANDILIDEDKKRAEDKTLPVIGLSDEDELRKPWELVKIDSHNFKLTGHRIEKFAKRTDFDDYYGRARFRDIMRKMGITRELDKLGCSPKAQIRIGQNSISLTEQYSD